MKKQEFVNAVAEKLDVKKKDAPAIIDGVVEVIAEAIVAGEEVPFGILGKFQPTERSARKARNPQTGEEMDVAASKGFKLKPSKKFVKETLNG